MYMYSEEVWQLSKDRVWPSFLFELMQMLCCRLADQVHTLDARAQAVRTKVLRSWYVVSAEAGAQASEVSTPSEGLPERYSPSQAHHSSLYNER